MILALACATPEPALCLPEECLVWEARELAGEGRVEEAEARCAQLTGAWEDECWFLLVDTLDLVGEPAWEACRMARTYERQCLGHALTREAEQLFDAGATPDEALERLTAGYARHYPPHRARAEAATLVEAEVERRQDAAGAEGD